MSWTTMTISLLMEGTFAMIPVEQHIMKIWRIPNPSRRWKFQPEMRQFFGILHQSPEKKQLPELQLSHTIPVENKVVFIHGPILEEVRERGTYSIRNRTALEVDGKGNKKSKKVDMRDVSSKVTTPGAHRGGTHRHEYSRNGNRIGFTYDDFLVQDKDRTIGFMQPDENAPEGYTHFFSVILKPAEIGKSNPGEIEKAYGDSWVDAAGNMRAFIGKVRAPNGIDYENDLFVADIPANIEITTSSSGGQDQYPEPPKGITIRRLTHGMDVSGIVRGSADGGFVAFAARDGDGIDQVFITKTLGSDKNPSRLPVFTHRFRRFDGIHQVNGYFVSVMEMYL